MTGVEHRKDPEPGKFNIAVITCPFHDEVGKATLENFIEVLEPLSNELVIITGDFPRWPGENVHTIRLKTDVHKGPVPLGAIKAVWADLMASFYIIKMSRRVDIVIFHIGTAAHLLSGLTARLLLGKKTVVCVTGLAFQTTRQKYGRAIAGLGRLYELIRFALADQIGVASPAAVDAMQLSGYREKIAINWALYINTDLFKVTKDFDKRGNLVGYVGRLVEGKGIMEFIDAMPVILKSRDDTRFLIGGGGPLHDKIVNKLQTVGLSDKVRLAGWIPHDELPNWLNELRLLVLPSASEGLPGIVQEAMPCGAVVLATPVGGIPDLVKDGETGFILENGTPECIASSVIRALAHPNLGGIAGNARRLIERDYTRDAMTEKYRVALNRLMRGKEG